MSFNSQDSNFEAIIPTILNVEGGYVNDPKDPGGATKYGISINANKKKLAEMGVTNIKDLTIDQAKRIYYEKYYLPSKCDTIEDLGLALIHFDAAVNHGVGAAGKMLSGLSRNFAYYAGNGLNKGMFNQLCLEYINARIKAYTADKNRDRYLHGWMNRLERIIDEYVKLQSKKI